MSVEIPQHCDQLCVVTSLFHPGGGEEQYKSHSSPYSIVSIKWNHIWKWFENYKALWKYKALLLVLGESHFSVFIIFPFIPESYYFKLYSYRLLFCLSWKMCIGWRPGFRKTTSQWAPLFSVLDAVFMELLHVTVVNTE